MEQLLHDNDDDDLVFIEKIRLNRSESTGKIIKIETI